MGKLLGALAEIRPESCELVLSNWMNPLACSYYIAPEIAEGWAYYDEKVNDVRDSFPKKMLL